MKNINPNLKQKKGTKESERYIDALVSALKILNIFEDGNPLRLKDIMVETSINKSRIIRICGTLIHMGYLMYNENNMTYSLGTRIQSLGKAYERHNPLYSVGKPLLRKLAEETKETCSIFVIEGNSIKCLARVEGPQALRYAITEGARNFKWQGASSKILLAHSESSFVEKIISEMPVHYANGKQFDKNSFLKELEEVRKNSFAYSEGEFTQDVSAFSCPIHDFNGRVCAAMTVTGPLHRLNKENQDFFLARLKETANSCTEILGYNN